jgi:hypothetical protein
MTEIPNVGNRKWTSPCALRGNVHRVRALLKILGAYGWRCIDAYEQPEFTLPLTETIVMEQADLAKLKHYASTTRSSVAFGGCTYIGWDWKIGKYPVGKSKTDYTGKKLGADVPDAMRGFQRLQKGQKPEYALTKVLDSSVAPIERNELSDPDESRWIDGRDPWTPVTAMPFFDPETRQCFIMIGAYGARGELSAVIDAHADRVTQDAAATEQRPLVQLCVREYVKDDGTTAYAMQLDLVDWITRPAAVLHIQPPPLSITAPADRGNDKAAGSSPSSFASAPPTQPADGNAKVKPKRKIAVVGGKPDIDEEVPF